MGVGHFGAARERYGGGKKGPGWNAGDRSYEGMGRGSKVQDGEGDRSLRTAHRIQGSGVTPGAGDGQGPRVSKGHGR